MARRNPLRRDQFSVRDQCEQYDRPLAMLDNSLREPPGMTNGTPLENGPRNGTPFLGTDFVVVAGLVALTSLTYRPRLLPNPEVAEDGSQRATH